MQPKFKMDKPLNNILQWNLRGLRGKVTELQCLLSKYHPEVVALQETKLPPNEKFPIWFIKRYFIYQKNRTAHGGGVALMIHKDVSHSLLNIATNLEAVAATIHYNNQNITVCSVYLPTDNPFPENDFKNLIASLPQPFLILGDTNTKHPMWGAPSSDIRGMKLAQILNDKSLHVLNSGHPTFHTPHNNYFAHLDTSICTPDLNLKFNWDTESDLYNSDHFPIILSHNIPSIPVNKAKRWNLEKTSEYQWQQYSDNISIPTNFQDPTIACQEISEHILDTAELYVKITSGTHNSKYYNPWWNDECAEAIKERKKALKILNRNGSPENLTNFKRARAKARLIINNSKRNSWRKFVSTINRFTPTGKIWEKVKKLDNKILPIPKIVLHINTNTTIEKLVTPTEVSESLGSHFSNISSTSNYTREFQQLKTIKENNPINFDTQENFVFNDPFTLEEFINILDPTTNLAPGEDNMPYELYK